MNLYETQHTVRSTEVDPARRLRLSALFTLLQEASIDHTTQLGIGRDKTLDRGLLWIVTLQQARITRLPAYDETVTLRTWPGKAMHLFFPRFTRMIAGDGTPLAEAAALWALMDQSRRKMVFPEEYGVAVPGLVTGEEPPLPRAPKPLPGGEESLFTVPYSYVDLNGHMNNTRYLDLAEDLMPEALRQGAVREIRIEYRGEARQGEEILLRRAWEDGLFTLTGEKEKRLFRLGIRYEL